MSGEFSELFALGQARGEWEITLALFMASLSSRAQKKEESQCL